MINIQYISIQLDEESSFPHQYSSNTELVALWAFFKQTYIDTAYN